MDIGAIITVILSAIIALIVVIAFFPTVLVNLISFAFDVFLFALKILWWILCLPVKFIIFIFRGKTR